MPPLVQYGDIESAGDVVWKRGKCLVQVYAKRLIELLENRFCVPFRGAFSGLLPANLEKGGKIMLEDQVPGALDDRFPGRGYAQMEMIPVNIVGGGQGSTWRFSGVSCIPSPVPSVL